MLTSKASAGAAAVLSAPAMGELSSRLLTCRAGCTTHEGCSAFLCQMISPALQLDSHASMRPSALAAPCAIDRDCDGHPAIECCNQAERLQGVSQVS